MLPRALPQLSKNNCLHLAFCALLHHTRQLPPSQSQASYNREIGTILRIVLSCLHPCWQVQKVSATTLTGTNYHCYSLSQGYFRLATTSGHYRCTSTSRARSRHPVTGVVLPGVPQVRYGNFHAGESSATNTGGCCARRSTSDHVQDHRGSSSQR